ncbi:protein AAL-toxin resistant 7 [Apium graveolens]|uniref:protein AAL-toxin resistant 7 n=1 Tax=Apium graveolens TaxID=4045 RepID=UPI003D7B0E81
MRGRSSKQGNSKSERVITDKNLPKTTQEPHLSGAYIRNLVKQLTSSRGKDTMNQKEHLGSSLVPDEHDGFTSHHQNLGESQETQPTQPPQHKKQVRRRLHTTRPYQEKFLNMAEARREIVTALKLHRASMKQANENHSQPTYQNQSESLQTSPPPQQKSKSRKNSRIYASSSTSNFSNNLGSLPGQSFPYQPARSSYSWPICSSAPPPIPENFNLLLPNQPLGLNLNLQDFNYLDTTIFQNNYISSSYYSPSSPSTSSSPPLLVTKEETPDVGLSQDLPVADPSINYEGDLGLHHAVDDEEMAEIRSVGEQHQIEWDDTMDLVTSAWWYKFFKNMEIEPNGFHPFDEGVEFPSWLNANDNCFEQLDEHDSGDYFQDPMLPQMDIGEIEGMDGEWLG